MDNESKIANALLCAKMLVEQLKIVNDNSEYRNVWAMYVIHGGKYTGPQYGQQLLNLEKALQDLEKSE